MSDLYNVNVDLVSQGENIYTATINDTVDTTNMVLVSMVVSGSERQILLQHTSSAAGSNPFTTTPYLREATETKVVVVVKNASGEIKGKGSDAYD